MFPIIVLIIILSTFPTQISGTDNIILELNVKKIRLPQIVEWMPKYLNCEIQISCAKDQREGQQEDEERWKGVVEFPYGKTMGHVRIPRMFNNGKCDLTLVNGNTDWIQLEGDAHHTKTVPGVRLEDCKVYKVVIGSGEFSTVQEHKDLSKECQSKRIMGSIEKGIATLGTAIADLQKVITHGFSSMKGKDIFADRAQEKKI